MESNHLIDVYCLGCHSCLSQSTNISKQKYNQFAIGDNEKGQYTFLAVILIDALSLGSKLSYLCYISK